ncbi:MAG: ECF transporter S component [Thaumarchaeota archaeon]|nr:ECF transporter S component [Candidatus Geocrenenecus arthurdayi]MCL7389661.1 ECF transporter S component [Candidatus Geocrenenecus arthurdayi]MCL7391344.1 ECF transporter S component [Candidatus Geocrenenecus arthurdayi]MCL7403836.1 ECF transporter S component [Candidatus Geocrenenecus arthurdayi]
MRSSSTVGLKAAKLALSTALVAAATAIFSIYVPATKGYFNLGETMVYFTALYFGPFIGAFAGGVGSALADLILGYTIYAPATLLIKAAEGWAAGYLALKLMGREKTLRIFILSLIVSAGYLFVILIVGLYILSGEFEASFIIVMSAVGVIHPSIWYPLAVLAIATPLYLTVKSKKSEGLLLLVLLLSGLIMVSGYFVYEQFILGYYAIAEVPVNFGQVIIGTAVAIPLYRAVKRLAARQPL